MAKFTYELVGSYYDRDQKNLFSKQRTIQLENVSLNTLESIDSFTCTKTKYDFMRDLPEEYQGMNHFSIRVTNNQTEETYYTKTIFDKKELAEVIAKTKKETVKIDGKYKTISKVPFNLFVAQTWVKIERALEQRDQDYLDHYYHPNSSYAFKLKRYIDSFPVGQDSVSFLFELKKEFLDYPIFRKALLDREKKFEINPVSQLQLHQEPERFSSSFEVKKVFPFADTINQIRFVNEHNIQYDEKEEFLDEEELIRAGYMEQGEEEVVTSKKGGKCV